MTPSSPAQRPAHPTSKLSTLLADLGPQIRWGNEINPSSSPPSPNSNSNSNCEQPQGEPSHDTCSTRVHPTGLAQIDRLLGGGIPHGRLSEISGSLSSGRTSLALALLATTTQRGECAAVVDWADAFDPPSAEATGVDLDRVLWVRTLGWHETLRCTERLLESDAFPLVLLDIPLPQLLRRGRAAPEQNPICWLRLARCAAQTQTALVLLSPQRLAGSQAAIALELQPAQARFHGTPALLEEFETRAVLVRHRSAPVGPVASLRMTARPSAA